MIKKELPNLLKNSTDTFEYNKKTEFTDGQDVAIKVFYNLVELDELCEALMCSHLQLLTRARILGVTGVEDKATAEDIELFIKAIDDGVQLSDVCNFFDVDIPEERYVFTEKSRIEARDALIKSESQIDLFGEK